MMYNKFQIESLIKLQESVVTVTFREDSSGIAYKVYHKPLYRGVASRLANLCTLVTQLPMCPPPA
jgi:hypothetical protein